MTAPGTNFATFWPRGKYPRVSYRVVSGWGRVVKRVRPGVVECEVYSVENPHEGQMRSVDEPWLRANAVAFESYRELRNWYLGQYLPVLKHDMEKIFEEQAAERAEEEAR